jgi:hypothetical protein
VVVAGSAPEINALVELTVVGGEAYASRVEDRQGDLITVAAPLDLLVADVPEIGRQVVLRWTAGARGRYVAPAEVVEVHHEQVSTWEIKITGQLWIEQNRRYVRGGGGEPIRLRRMLEPEDPAVDGRVVDISERSVRGQVGRFEVKAGDPVVARIVLDEDVVEVEGYVLRVLDQPEHVGAGVVVIFEPDEHQATVIRRYVLRQQLLARTRAGR